MLEASDIPNAETGDGERKPLQTPLQGPFVLLIQVGKVCAILTGKVLGREVFLWPIAALHFS